MAAAVALDAGALVLQPAQQGRAHQPAHLLRRFVVEGVAGAVEILGEGFRVGRAVLRRRRPQPAAGQQQRAKPDAQEVVLVHGRQCSACGSAAGDLVVAAAAELDQ
ncbi:MAG: hypothetical protein OSA97_20830, partial [Nevskia sp.]|nr:hypothetical protein [Nevskia sp.]